MGKTRLSLCYLAGYLWLGGVGLLLAGISYLAKRCGPTAA